MTQTKTHLSVVLLVIFPLMTLPFNAQRVHISKDGFLIISSQPEKERKIDRAEVSWRDVVFRLSSTALYYFVSHPPNLLSADTPILAEKFPV